MDPFETLGLEPTFRLSSAVLSERQRELSKTLHPDKFVGRPAGERRAALSQAITVNEAHRALKEPLSRAEALLTHLGLTLEEGAAAPADPLLLMEMMERREELRDAGRSGDAAAILGLKQATESEVTDLSEQLGELFDAALQDRPDQESPAAQEIHRLVGALRYHQRFLDEANAFLDEFG